LRSTPKIGDSRIQDQSTAFRPLRPTRRQASMSPLPTQDVGSASVSTDVAQSAILRITSQIAKLPHLALSCLAPLASRLCTATSSATAELTLSNLYWPRQGHQSTISGFCEFLGSDQTHSHSSAPTRSRVHARCWNGHLPPTHAEALSWQRLPSSSVPCRMLGCMHARKVLPDQGFVSG